MSAFVLALAAGMAAGDVPKNDAPLDETTGHGLASLQGAWRLRSLTVDGTTWDMESLRTARLVIAGNRSIGELDGKKLAGSTIAINDTRRPWVLLIWGPGQRTVKAICRVDRDTLMICENRNGGQLPREFVSREGTGQALLVFQRQKK
jgi:uncharacterized protein (TIGR03067 family)